MTDIAKLEEETQKEINDMLANLEKQEKTPGAEATVKTEAGAETSETHSMKEFHGTSGDSSLDETVGSLKVDETADQGVLATVTSIRPTGGGNAGSSSSSGSAPTTQAPGSLQMKLSGSMSLDLTYETAGQTVTVSFTDDAFVVRLGDGAEFRLPVKKSQKGTKAA